MAGEHAVYRDYIWDEVIGRLPDPALPANPRTRLIYDEPKFRGYEVMLDVWPGRLRLRHPAGAEGYQPASGGPSWSASTGWRAGRRTWPIRRSITAYYHRFAAALAEQGFVTYAPQNPYIGEDRFRLIQRKAHPLKLSLFSFILGQHERTLDWLGDAAVRRPANGSPSTACPTAARPRCACRRCSTAMRSRSAPPISTSGSGRPPAWTSRYSYMFTHEYDMLEFDFANVVNYADLANLMAPRPFMVERGHDDGVAPDEWVAYEYAKVRRFYDTLGICRTAPRSSSSTARTPSTGGDVRIPAPAFALAGIKAGSGFAAAGRDQPPRKFTIASANSPKGRPSTVATKPST